MIKYMNVRKTCFLNVFADLDDFDIYFEVNEDDVEKAVEVAQDAFDSWYNDKAPTDTLLERICDSLTENSIDFDLMEWR